MIKPLAQLVTGSDILQPSFQPQRCLLYAARPETVHQEARPVAGCRRFVNSLDLNHVKNLSPGSRLATRDCTTRPRLNSWRMNRLRSLTVVFAGLAAWNKQFSISGEMDFPLFYRKKIFRTLGQPLVVEHLRRRREKTGVVPRGTIIRQLRSAPRVQLRTQQLGNFGL